jgi:hypothetical protein
MFTKTQTQKWETIQMALGQNNTIPAFAQRIYTNPTLNTDRIFKNTHKLVLYPHWEINRHGMSCTDVGNVSIFIGGEHEDYYDPNFCIYNDVITVDASNTIAIYEYPIKIFPPTDFHKAIHQGNYIWIVGSVGYSEYRNPYIQMCRLHIPSMKMELIPAKGTNIPPWMAFYDSDNSAILEDNIIIVNGMYRFDIVLFEWK